MTPPSRPTSPPSWVRGSSRNGSSRFGTKGSGGSSSWEAAAAGSKQLPSAGGAHACPEQHFCLFPRAGYKAGMTHIVRDVEKPGSKLHKKEVRLLPLWKNTCMLH